MDTRSPEAYDPTYPTPLSPITLSNIPIDFTTQENQTTSSFQSLPDVPLALSSPAPIKSTEQIAPQNPSRKRIRPSHFAPSSTSDLSITISYLKNLRTTKPQIFNDSFLIFQRSISAISMSIQSSKLHQFLQNAFLTLAFPFLKSTSTPYTTYKLSKTFSCRPKMKNILSSISIPSMLPRIIYNRKPDTKVSITYTLPGTLN
jgi:hypothetical protein